MPFGISLPELLILLVVLLLIFGAKRLPEMGRSLGKGMREFKDGISGVEESARTTTPTPAQPELPPSSPEPTASNSTATQEAEREPVS
ncbi:MAG TPA: twin-arginine translocase TatA/TatE family subunit [Gaiellaceae bacterium]|nr:twin-arginine translocase TatA/TatE family subunit [Gaiellaceae bacterium]